MNGITIKHMKNNALLNDNSPVAEGMTFNFLGEDVIRPELLQTFPFDSPTQHILTETDEFSAVCPFSGLPDYATLRIEYYPTGGRCVELKSLKYYIISFRNVGIYQEQATKRIRCDLENLLGCSVKITTFYKTRGGFDTVCTEGDIKEEK